ncbi:MAG: VIT domain-containing protein [Kiritimatiellia bacterium]|jgi:hypothetical protein|nr:VIT domain-containing protein [Kiritimatiellia bacterium]
MNPESTSILQKARPAVGVFALVFGVILPTFTLLFEIVSGFCACLSFDPVPSIWHALLLSVVPIANLAAYVAIRSSDYRHAKGVGLINGAAVGVSACYAIAFLPIAPFAVMALPAFGLGLLPLTPFITLVTGLRLRVKLRQMFEKETGLLLPRIWIPLLAASLALCLLAAPTVLAFAGIKMACKRDTRTQGIRLLRDYVEEDHLLRFCYSVNRPLSPAVLLEACSNFVDLVLPGAMEEIRPQNAREVYYRVTGTPYNAVKAPAIRSIRGGTLGSAVTQNDVDFDQGGDAVAARIRGLSLVESRTESSVDADCGTSYTEWTLRFRNDSALQREARSQVLLPPGGVVSRLTLWIDGEEREAAFSGTGSVKAAYQKVVRRRRDPVLVTSKGSDLVMVQCFPVPPGGGEMQVRLGITAPLSLESKSEGMLRIPQFVERNFNIAPQAAPELSLHSATAIRGIVCQIGTPPTLSELDPHTVRGNLEQAHITSPLSISFGRNRDRDLAWTEDMHGNEGLIIRQRILGKQVATVKSFIFVIDGSRRMGRHGELIAEAIASVPADREMYVLLASDDVVELYPLTDAGEKTALELRHNLAASTFEGGRDSVPALIRAVELASGIPDCAIIWLHAPQPVELAALDSATDKLGRHSPTIYDLQFEAGPNVISRALEKKGFLRPVPVFGDVEADLRGFLGQLTGEKIPLQYVRSRHEPQGDEDLAEHASDHLARLWANGEVLRMAGSGSTADVTNAVALASLYQLVTPVTGAVVLETQQQYDEAGLLPVDAGSTPRMSVPEPGTLALMIAGGVVASLGGILKRRHVRCA